MPTIEFNKKDFDKILVRALTIEELETYFPLAKAELKDYVPKTGELKVEFNDTNRPDLWSLEGFARQINIKLSGELPAYPFFSETVSSDQRIIVSQEMQQIRPYIAACTAVGPAITEPMLLQMIQTQEKLSENFGQHRLSLSIGIYELNKVTFPVRYLGVNPDTTSFIPLGYDEEMTLRKILDEHPKGIDYRYILKEHEIFPYFVDNNGGVLSFPPIINSRRSGEIKVGEQRLFIESTGNDINAVLLGINIFACNLYDIGFNIKPVKIEYPYDTVFGKEITSPYHYKQSIKSPLSSFEKALGRKFSTTKIIESLKNYGINASEADDEIDAILPPYRLDYLHSVDLIEDFAMSVGYEQFEPLLPPDFSVGRLSKTELFSDKARNLMVGYGFEEIISNILISKEELADKMAQPDAPIIEVANPMSLAHAALRNRILPSLLRVEAASAKSAYPHKIFEIGDVVEVASMANMGAETSLFLSTLIAHPTANFSELDSYLTILMYHLGQEFSKSPVSISGYIEGRAGNIVVQGKVIGVIGELSPIVLESWNIGVPISTFEINMSKLLELN